MKNGQNLDGNGLMMARHKALIPMFAVLLSFIIGCNAGEQQGDFSVSSVRTSYYNDPDGFVIVFFGNMLSSDAEVVGPNKAILCIACIGHNEFADGYTGTSIENGRVTSTIVLRDGDVSFNVSWNRKSGLIKVASAEFDFKNGNVVVVANGEATNQLFVPFECNDVTSAIEAIANQEPTQSAFAIWAARGGK